MVVVVVGTQPPPVHGMAAVNAAMFDRLRVAGVQPLAINTAARNLKRGLRARLSRLPRVLRGLVRLLFTPGLHRATLYIGVSGGIGQVYDIAFLATARIRQMRCVVHHHNYSYLSRTWRLTRSLIKAAGDESVHVVMCEGMARDLRRWYPAVKRAFVMSNAWLLAQASISGARQRDEIKVVGFLSNISVAKGVFTFLDTVAALGARGCGVAAKLAGPFQDGETEVQVRHRLTTLPNVQYVGPKYGADKDRFLASIDVLLFPSETEAEPVTVLEALAHGVPVIATDRGCIPCELADGAGVVIGQSTDFVAAAAEQIQTWHEQPQVFRCACAAAHAHFDAVRDRAQRALDQLVGELLDRSRT